MGELDAYTDAFVHARLTRSSEGVLEVILHTRGNSLVFNDYAYEEFVDLFHQINQDAENRVIILTGAGEAFIDRIDAEGFDFYSPHGEGKKLLPNLIDYSRAGGRCAEWTADSHSEFVLLADIVIATPDTVFQDKPHSTFSIVPGDGMHSSWQKVIGPIRGHTFLLTQKVIGAEEAKALGVIGEIVPRDHLLSRVCEIAGRIAKLPPLTTSYTRIALTQKQRRIVDESAGYGLVLEGISAAAAGRSPAHRGRKLASNEGSGQGLNIYA